MLEDVAQKTIIYLQKQILGITCFLKLKNISHSRIIATAVQVSNYFYEDIKR